MSTELTRYSFEKKSTLVKNSKNTMTPNTSKLKSICECQLLTFHLKKMIFRYFTLKQVKHNSRALYISR